MPKLIIKRETPQRFTRQAILFWLLGLLPLALLAGFLTGHLISQLGHPQPKAGQAPILPLAPASQSIEPTKPQRPALPLTLPTFSKLAPDTLSTQPLNPPTASLPSLSLDSSEPKLRLRPTEQKTSSQATKNPAEPTKTPRQSTRSINHLNTKDQRNNHSRPTSSPSPRHKPVKSPQTVSESPRPARPITSAGNEAKASTIAKPQATAPTERGNDHDYRLLEQSLGIPLQ